MKQALLKTIDKLKDEDLITLSYLYLYRAFDVEQIMENIYRVNTDTPAGKRSRTTIIKRMLAESVITVSKYLPSREAIQITNKGIEIVRYTRDIPNEIFDGDIKTIKKGYYTAADLQLGERFINHQVHLNQFMLDFTKRARDLNIPWKYFDEKFLSQYVGMRPDGLITMLDYDFFIEIDMASESQQQLIEKWQHYREFMKTNEFKYKQRKIIVLFDVDNLLSEKKIKNRIELVKSTISKTILDAVTGDFEIVVKPRDELITYMFDSIAASLFQRNEAHNKVHNYFKQAGYSISYGYDLNKVLQGDFYNYYVRKLDSNGHIKIDGAIAQELFLDFYLDEEISVLHRVDWYQKNNALYKDRFGRNIKLVLAVNDVESAFKDFKLLGQSILGQPGIFLLDMSKFNDELPLFENLSQLGPQGEVFKPITPDLSRRKFVYKIADREIRQKTGRMKHTGGSNGKK